jgi:flagellar biosynthesis/type III secretory pathway chaperone
MKMAEGSIETLFQEKEVLYRKLVELVKNEKKQIVDADVTALWQMSDRKQALVSEIEQIRGQILEAATAISVDHGMVPRTFQADRLAAMLSADLGRRLIPVQSSLVTLKKEIQSVCFDNKQYIESKLGMIDELMTIMTGRNNQRQGYGAEYAAGRSGGPMLFRREV